MESTYSHLKDSDHIREAREAFDLETEEIESELTPGVCPRCGTNPPENANLCHVCGLEFTPGATETMEEVDDAVRKSYQEAEDMDQVEKVQVLDEILDEAQDDPELKAALIEKMSED